MVEHGAVDEVDRAHAVPGIAGELARDRQGFPGRVVGDGKIVDGTSPIRVGDAAQGHVGRIEIGQVQRTRVAALGRVGIAPEPVGRGAAGRGPVELQAGGRSVTLNAGAITWPKDDLHVGRIGEDGPGSAVRNTPSPMYSAVAVVDPAG